MRLSEFSARKDSDDAGAARESGEHPGGWCGKSLLSGWEDDRIHGGTEVSVSPVMDPEIELVSRCEEVVCVTLPIFFSAARLAVSR